MNQPPRLRAGHANPRAHILMGGGIDSTALIPFFQQKGFEVTGVHFDYGQPACSMEQRAVANLGRHYGIETTSELLRPVIMHDAKEFRFRNAILVLAGGQMCTSPCLLAIGIHVGTPFYDCSSKFLERMQGLLSDYSGGTVRLVAPWVDMDKRGVVSMATRGRVPIELTYSCQRGNERPCGTCLSCLDRLAAL